MRQRGHDVVLACTPGCPIWNAAQVEGVPLEPVTFKRGISWEAVGTILKIIRKYRVQVVNTHSSADGWSGAVAARLARRRGLPVHVRTRHLSNPLKPNKANFLLYSRLTNFTLVTGEALRKSLIEVNGLSGERIMSVPTGVDLEIFDPGRYTREDFRGEIGLQVDEFAWVMVAILRSMKGHLVLVDAAAQVLEKHPRARFVLVGGTTGPTPLPDEIKAKIHALGMDQKFIFTGMREDIARILHGCDAAVLASTRGEGVPQSLAQAQAMGLPVVASDVGAISEIVRDDPAAPEGATGYLATPGDATSLARAMLATMVGGDETRARARRGRELIVAEYSLQAMTDKVEAVYNRLLAEVAA